MIDGILKYIHKIKNNFKFYFKPVSLFFLTMNRNQIGTVIIFPKPEPAMINSNGSSP